MRRILTALFAIALLIGGAPALAQSPPAHPDHAAVQSWLEQHQAAWAAGDGAGMYRMATDDVEWINVMGMHWRGKAEVVKAHETYLATIFRGVTMRLEAVESVRPVGDDTVVAVARWSIGQFTSPAGHVFPPSQDRMTLVFERSADGLLLAHAANIEINQAAQRSNPIPPPAEAP